MKEFTVNMYFVCKDKKHFHSCNFFALSENDAEKQAKKTFVDMYYPFCIASFYQKEIQSVEIIDIWEVEKEEPPKNDLSDDIDDWEDKSMTEEEYVDTISGSDFAKYFC